jgi:adenylosuccinate lyase
MAQEHDRHGGTYIAEWALLPEVCILTDTALSWLIDLLERLKIDEARMLSNIWDAGGIVMTENLVHALAEFMPKSQARLIVEDAAHEATATCKPIVDVLNTKVEISQTIPQNILREALEPKNSTGSSGEMVNKISTRLKKFVKKAK